MNRQEIDIIMQLNQRNIEADLQKDQRNINETLRANRRDALRGKQISEMLTLDNEILAPPIKYINLGR
jgi:hypothetical protein